MIQKIKLLVSMLAALFVGHVWGETRYGLANEGATTTRSAQHWKRKTAMAIGKPALADGDDETLEAAHDRHMQSMANELAAMPPGPGEVTSAENEKTPEQKAAELAEASRKEKERVDALANEQVVAVRKENVELQLTNAISAGRILPADKAAWEEKFGKDYEGSKTALANEKPKLKTTPRTVGLGNINAETVEKEQDRQSKVLELVNEAMPKFNGDYDKAFQSVKHDPKNKALFESMKKPKSEETK